MVLLDTRGDRTKPKKLHQRGALGAVREIEESGARSLGLYCKPIKDVTKDHGAT